MQELILSYRHAKKLAEKIVPKPNRFVDEEQVKRDMVSDLNYALDWMNTGQPGQTYRGATTKKVYQKKLLLNTDMFPSLDIMPEPSYTMQEAHKKAVNAVLSVLTERQLTCFLLNSAHMRTYEEIADELGIKVSSVQKHIERAREKIAAVIDEYGISI